MKINILLTHAPRVGEEMKLFSNGEMKTFVVVYIYREIGRYEGYKIWEIEVEPVEDGTLRHV